MSEGSRNLIALALLGCGILFVVLGILRGEAAVVLQKAVNVCLECIGIG